jgi:hypothetical protein
VFLKTWSSCRNCSGNIRVLVCCVTENVHISNVPSNRRVKPEDGSSKLPSKRRHLPGRLRSVTVQMTISKLLSLGYTYSVKMAEKLYLCLINYVPRHQDVWGIGGIAPSFLTSALDGVAGQFHALVALSLGKSPFTHYIGDCVGTRAGLDAMKKITTFAHVGSRNQAIHVAAHRYTDWTVVWINLAARSQ